MLCPRGIDGRNGGFIGGRPRFRGPMAHRILWTVAVAILMLPVPGAALSSVPAGVAPGSHVPLDASAFWALGNVLKRDDLFVRSQGEGIFFVEQQMLGILTYLAMAERDPAQAAEYEDAAIDVWRQTVASYNSDAKYFHTSVTTESVCISYDPNAWALLAARELAARVGDRAPLAAQRADAVTATLTEAVREGEANGVDVCNPNLNQKPLALWALLRTLPSATSSNSVMSAVRAVLDAALDDAFDGGFFDAGGLYIPSVNAQFLLVLTEAAKRLGDSSYVQARDELAAFERDHGVRVVDGEYVAVPLNPDRTVIADAGVQPDNQLWVAFALHAYRTQTGADVPDETVTGLLDTLFSRFWDPRTGGLISLDGKLSTSTNQLAVLAYASPAVRDVQRELSDVSLLVAADAARTYPDPRAAEAGRFLLTNEVSQSFTIGVPSAGVVLLYPATHFGDFQFGFPDSSFYPPPSVIRVPSGSPVTVQALGADDGSFLRFDAAAVAGSTQFLLRGYVPIDPLDYTYAEAIEVRIENPLPDPLIIPRLAFEIEAADVSWQHVAVNGITFPQYQATSVGANTFVPRPHTRMVLNNLPLAPGVNTIRLSYEDVSPPQIKAFDLYADPQLRERVSRPAPGQPYEALTGQEVFAVVQASDNARVAAVSVDVRPSGRDAFTVDLARSEAQANQWVGSLRIPSTGEATLTSFAEDASGFLSEPASERVDVRSSFFAGASVLLFVFAAGLFLATAFIYLKVRRRKGR